MSTEADASIRLTRVLYTEESGESSGRYEQHETSYDLTNMEHCKQFCLNISSTLNSYLDGLGCSAYRGFGMKFFGCQRTHAKAFEHANELLNKSCFLADDKKMLRKSQRKVAGGQCDGELGDKEYQERYSTGKTETFQTYVKKPSTTSGEYSPESKALYPELAGYAEQLITVRALVIALAFYLYFEGSTTGVRYAYELTGIPYQKGGDELKPDLSKLDSDEDFSDHFEDLINFRIQHRCLIKQLVFSFVGVTYGFRGQGRMVQSKLKDIESAFDTWIRSTESVQSQLASKKQSVRPAGTSAMDIRGLGNDDYDLAATPGIGSMAAGRSAFGRIGQQQLAFSGQGQ